MELKSFREFVKDEVNDLKKSSLLESANLVESTSSFKKKIAKMYQDMESVSSKNTAIYLKALKAKFKELAKMGYKEEDDYGPSDDASDEEWNEYETIEKKLEKKYKTKELLRDPIYDKLADKIFSELKSALEERPELRGVEEFFKDTSKTGKVYAINKLKPVFINESFE